MSALSLSTLSHVKTTFSVRKGGRSQLDVATPLSRTRGVFRCKVNNRRSLKVLAVAEPIVADKAHESDLVGLSGLEGKAMLSALKPDWPTKKEILSVIPEHCFEKNTTTSMMYAAISTVLTVTPGILAYMFIPLQAAYVPAWIAYAAVTGTIATGAWVVAHECGHGAFSNNKFIQDLVGYVLHTALLVPYFAWQRSHAVHHSRTNHVTEGETHVPALAEEAESKFTFKLRDGMGDGPFALVHTLIVLAFGWPVYLLTGASGGPVRGKTNHFWPFAGATGRHALFPGGWKDKVFMSDVGIVGFLGALAYWAYSAGSVWPVIALYVGPYMFTNAWLVLYTWLQHTDVDVPHFGPESWTWEKGAFMTIDRPYGPLFDFLHHRIGSTHVAHHLNHQIPHYHAKEATEAIKTAFPDLYLHDPTPVWKATMRVAAKCIGVQKNKLGNDLWTFAPSA